MVYREMMNYLARMTGGEENCFSLYQLSNYPYYIYKNIENVPFDCCWRSNLFSITSPQVISSRESFT
jgi:hypothetical protein